MARLRNQELESDEVHTHLQAGKEVVKIAVTYADRLRLSWTTNSTFAPEFLEVIKDEAGDIEADDAYSRMDADFSIALELRLSSVYGDIRRRRFSRDGGRGVPRR